MARDLMDETYYTAKTKGAMIPIKWTAPEVCPDKFSVAPVLMESC